MSDLDDRITVGLERLAEPGDPEGALERVVRARRRWRVVRRFKAAALSLAVLAGTVGGVLALTRAFDLGGAPADQRVPVPKTSPSPTGVPKAEQRCPVFGENQDLPSSFRRVGGLRGGDVTAITESATGIRIWGDEHRPFRCRYVLMVFTSGPFWTAPIRSFAWLPDRPSLLMTAEVDGEPGLEIVVDFGGPGHPHRSGQVFTFEPGSGSEEDALVPMRLAPPVGLPILFPLSGEDPAGVDCAGGPGTIIVTYGGFAGGRDTHFRITRRFYRADGATFVRTGTETYTVPVGTETNRWPELANDPFRSCQGR